MANGTLLDELMEQMKKNKQAPSVGGLSPSAPKTSNYGTMFKKALDETYRYAQVSPQTARDVANTIAPGGAMTAYTRGDVKSFDWDEAIQAERDRASATDYFRKSGLYNSDDYLYNDAYRFLVGDDYLKKQQFTLPMGLAASSVRDAIEDVRRSLVKNDPRAEWRNFYDLYGYETEQPLEIMLRAEAIAKGTNRTVRDFDLMDDDTYDREYGALETWYKGLDPVALTERYDSQTDDYLAKIKTVDKEISRRSEIDEFRAGIRSNEDYGTMSAFTGPGLPEGAWSQTRAVTQEDIDALNDPYSFINSGATWEQLTNSREKLAYVAEYMDAGYNMLTPDEIADYNYLINTGREDDAAHYLELLRPELLLRRAMVAKSWQTVKATNPVLAVPTWLEAGIQNLANIAYLPYQFYEAATGRDDPFSPAFDALNKNKWTSEAQLGWIEDSGMADWLKDVASVVYKGAAGWRDNVFRLAASGFNPTVSLIIAGAQSTSGSLHESSERDDVSGAAKIVKALATGAIEMGTEKIGLDALFSKGHGGALEYLKGVILSELGEESLNYISEPALEAAVAFLFDHEAEIMSGPEFWSGLTDTMLTTAISSILMGGGGAVQMDAGYRRTGKGLRNDGDVESVLQIAEGLGADTTSAQIAKSIRAAEEGGKKVSTRELGKLVSALSSDIGEQNAAAVNAVYEDAIADRLIELGEEKSKARKQAKVIRRISAGEVLSAAERMSVNWSDNASQVVRELTTEVREGDEGRVGRDWKVRAVQLAEETSAPYVDKGVLFEKALHTKPGATTEAQAAAPVTPDAVVQQGEEMAAAGKNKFGPKPLARAVIFDADGVEHTGEVARFEKDKDGMHAVVATTADGKTANVTVDLESITASASAGIGSIVRYVQNASTRGHDMSAAEASTMIRLYEQEGGDAKAFIDGFEKAYLAGYAGIELDSAGISEGVAKIAYDQGKAEAVADEKGRVARATRVRADSKGVVSWLGKVSSGKEVRGTGDPNALSAAMRKMTSSQRTTVQVVQAFADKFKTSVVLFESSEENIGSIENGSYDPNTNTIYIDINSGADSAESIKAGRKHNTLGHAMVRTLGHELTHHLESTSPEAYATYKQAVKTALKEQGQNWATLVRGKLDTARNAGRKLTYAGAEAEVIADASEYMLQNSKFVKEIDNSTKGRVKKFIKDFMKKLGEVFSTLAREHKESAAIRKEIDGVKQYMGNLQQLWDAAMEESMGMEKSVETSMEAEVVEFSDVNTQFSIREEAPPKKTDEYQSKAMTTAADLQNPDGSRMFSLRSFTDDYDTYRDMLTRHNVDELEIKALFDTIDVVMKAIETDREILDFGWNVGREDRSFNPVKQNSDPLYKVSIDFSTLCRKRLLQQTVQERLESMYDTVLTKAERVAIRNELMKLREEGKQIEVACALCYVESTRLKSPAQIQRFFDNRRAVLVDYFAKKNKEYAKLVNAKADELIVKFGHEPGTKKKELNTFQKNAVTNLKQSMNKDYKPSAEEEAIIATAMSLPGESFKTDKGLWDLKREHEEIFDAYTSFVRNATKSKGIEGDEAWWAGDSESISDSLIESMNAENGLRTQSWSDFQVIHLLDYMAAIIELSTRNAKMQSYTKVPDFVNLMGDTGVMINLSLIPKGFDGTLNYDPIEGMPIEEALALRDSFPETAGTICIGITKKHIEMLLANPDIDYVIPYHSSSLDKKTRQQMGMKVWEDFQAYQNEKNKDYPNTDSKSDKYHKKPLFSEWFDYKTVSSRANELAAEAIAELKNPTESQKVDAKRRAAEQAMKEAADRYKELCHQRGLQEKFEQFSGEPNYWKLLIDRKMINQKTGEIIEQKAVKPRFDKDRILSILSAEVNRFKEQNADKDAAVKHIVDAWENGEIRKAARSKKVRDQVSAFNDTVTVANIVASAEELDNSDIRYSTRDQTDTESFKRWFGNSQVVNADGTPKVMYHGSSEHFTVFDKSALKDKLGFFFTEDKREAQDYGMPRAFYLKIENPYDIWDGLDRFGKTIEEKVQGLQNSGYDGIESYSHGTTWYIAFEPTQIKSATDNVGNFDPNNPDIRYSTRDLPPEVTAREFLTEADSSIAETVEERNALSIYQGLLLKHADASDKVIAAERVLAAADEADLPEARKALTAARARQKELYNRLLNVERTAHVQTIVKRTNRIISDLSGKNQAEMDKMVSALERKVESLRLDLQGLKVAAKTQREADARASERDIVAHEIKAAKEQREADLRAAKRELAVYKSKAAQALIANNEKHTKRIADLRERNELNVEIGKKARHIKRAVKRLNDRIIHEEDYKNVKEEMKPAVHKLVMAFVDDFGGLVFDSKTASKLKSVYDMLKQDDETVEYFDEEVSDWLTTLAELARADEKRRASGSTLENLNDKLYIYTTLSDIVDHVAHMVNAADTMFVEGKKAEVSAVTEEISNTLTAKKDRRELAGWPGKIARFADNLIVKGNMMPQFFFEGLNNNGMMRLYDGLQDGVREYSDRMLIGEEFMADVMSRHGYHSWDGMKKPVAFKTKQGHTIYLTRENMMWIYATAKREASNPMMDTHHLDEGGITYDEIPTEKGRQIEGKGVHHLITAEDVAAITQMLTADQIAYVDECVEFLSTECADWGNEASMRLYGIKKYKEGYYFPFKVDSDQLYKNSAAGATSTVSDARVKHISFSHSIKKGANTPLVMGSFTGVITDHINQMATYSGMVVPIENMSRVLNRKVDDGRENVNIRSLIARKYGDNTARYIDDLLKDLNGGPQTDNRGALDAGLRLFKRNAVVGKLSVALQQPTAITRAFAYISPKWFASIRLERPKHTWDRMMKYSSTTFLKDMGGFNVGMGKGASNWLERGDLGDYKVYKRAKFLLDQKSLKDAVGEWNDFLTGLPGFMDKIAWCAIWNAAENEQAHKHPTMDRNSDEFLEMVGRRFDDIVNHTQVYDSILSKSQNMRSKNAIAKMATSFMAESTLNMNLAYRAIVSKDGKQIAKVTASLILNAILGAAAYALIGAFNKDDDDRTLEEKYATAFAGRLMDNLNPIASIPYLSDIWNKLQGYDVERTDLSFLFDLIEDGGKFWNKMTDPEEVLSYRDYENFVGGLISTATGIPAKNWMGDARRIWNMTHTSTADAPFSSVWYGILDEVVPGRGVSKNAYYERYLAALRDGDKQEQYDLKEYLTKTKGAKEEDITEGVRNAYKAEYQRGGIDKQAAIKFLLDHNLVTGDTADKKKQKAFQYVDKWDEGTDGYSAYNTLKEAFVGGNSSKIQTAWRELTSNGYTDDQIKSQTKTILKALVQNGSISPSKATELLRKYAPYKDDKNNVKYPQDWLNEKE